MTCDGQSGMRRSIAREVAKRSLFLCVGEIVVPARTSRLPF